MGFRICYIGGKCTPEELAAHMQLDITSVAQDMPDGDSWVARIKESGWSVLWLEDDSFIQKNSDLISHASQAVDLVACEVNETCMWASAEYLRDGTSVWKVTHAGDGDDRFNLNEYGALPDEFEDIKARNFGLQESDDECDYVFEIPLDTAKRLLRFRHDQYLEPEAVDQFQIVKIKKKPGLLASLFGGG